MHYIFSIIIIFGLLSSVCVTSCGASPRSYTTSGLLVSHDVVDESMYYDTPATEVAYNVQIMRSGKHTYTTMFHSEPRKTAGMGYPGDSIKTGFYTGSFTYKMPVNLDFRLYGHPTDTASILYSAESHDPSGWSGTGNPMLIKGINGDKYYYAFFIAVTDDNRDRDITSADYRHYLCQARSLDMINWEIRTDSKGVQSWMMFGSNVPDEWRRPRPLSDVDGNYIRSVRATKKADTQGLIGSICYYNGKFYYFYTDVNPDGVSYLYLRTTTDITRDRTWSAAIKVSKPIYQIGTLVRVAKAYNMNRWVVLYNGYRYTDGLHGDLMLQYTQNMTVTGKGGIDDITYFDRYENGCGISSKNLGLSSGRVYAQHYFMTNESGNLTIPDTEENVVTRGGLLTWSDLSGSIYGDKVYTAGWNVSQIKPSATRLPK